MSTTVREFVDMMLRSAGDLPAGLDSKIEFGICDGAGMQVVGCVDIGQRAEDNGALLLRGHLHPEDVPKPMRVQAEVLDHELRDLIADEH